MADLATHNCLDAGLFESNRRMAIYLAQRLFVREGVNMTREHHKDEALTLSVEHAARLIDVSRATAYRLVRSGELRAVRIGRRVLILKKLRTEMLEAEDDTSSS
jgi:excisionase family DNA binding protein